MFRRGGVIGGVRTEGDRVGRIAVPGAEGHKYQVSFVLFLLEGQVRISKPKAPVRTEVTIRLTLINPAFPRTALEWAPVTSAVPEEVRSDAEARGRLTWILSCGGTPGTEWLRRREMHV